MTRTRAISLGVLLLAVSVTGSAWHWSYSTAADLPRRRPEQFIPAEAFLFVSQHGSESTQKAYQQTAAHAALEQSGFLPVIHRLIDGVIAQLPEPSIPQVENLLSQIARKGYTVGAWLTPQSAGVPRPALAVILHEGSKFEPFLTRLIQESNRKQGELIPYTIKIQNREIHAFKIPEGAGAIFSWWGEADHLVITVGLEVPEKVLDVMNGRQPNVSAHPLMKKHGSEQPSGERVRTSLSWLDIPALLAAYGKTQVPIDSKPGKVVPLGEMLNVLYSAGNWGPLVLESELAGVAHRFTIFWENRAEPSATGPMMTLDALPPLPVNTTDFLAGTFDAQRAYDDILAKAPGVIRLGTDSADEAATKEREFKTGLESMRSALGVDLRTDLLGALGTRYCLAMDCAGGGLSGSPGLIVAVRDADQLRTTLNTLLKRLQQQSPKQRIDRISRHGREMVSLSFANSSLGLTYAVDKDWLVLALVPQYVEAVILRLDQKLPRWQPSAEQKQALATVPRQFRTISLADARGGMGVLAGIAPLAVGVLETAINYLHWPFKLPVTALDFPPPEVVVQPLFPSVWYTTANEQGWKLVSRDSFSVASPSTILAIAALTTAISLPAIQQAEVAAQRTKVRNQLKQIGLAAHNTHDSYNQFPPLNDLKGRQALPPLQRLSWQADLLPFLEQNRLYSTLHFDATWNSKSNEPAVKTPVPLFLSPEAGGKVTNKEGYALTHFIGNGGLGADGPTEKANSKKAGAFGINRKTGIRDFHDGLSNTIFSSESSGNYGPWAANGPSTIRPLTKQPYIQGPDGLGSPRKGAGTATVLFADGSVRTISKTIDPKVLEALMTIRGGESVNDDF